VATILAFSLAVSQTFCENPMGMGRCFFICSNIVLFFALMFVVKKKKKKKKDFFRQKFFFSHNKFLILFQINNTLHTYANVFNNKKVDLDF
jgi:hypothetical protein